MIRAATITRISLTFCFAPYFIDCFRLIFVGFDGTLESVKLTFLVFFFLSKLDQNKADKMLISTAPQITMKTVIYSYIVRDMSSSCDKKIHLPVSKTRPLSCYQLTHDTAMLAWASDIHAAARQEPTGCTVFILYSTQSSSLYP